MTTEKKDNLLIHGFIDAANKFNGHHALDIDNNKTTYGELKNHIEKIAGCIIANTQPSASFVAILADRSLSAYSGVLGTLLAGKAYVPLNHKFPVERSLYMADFSSVDIIIVGPECYEYFFQILQKIKKNIVAIFPETTKPEHIEKDYPQHVFFGADELNLFDTSKIPSNVHPDTPAYMLFTSGSTGIPKAVPVSNRNVVSYIDNISSLYDFNETDRFYQVSDLTFDLSVQDLFLCWKSGGCLCAPGNNNLVAIPRFIKEKQLTVWLFVPSVAILFSKMRLLKPGSFPSLRYSMFCGEALPASTAETWQAAASYSTLINLYGPTEATVAIAHYKWNKNSQENNSINGIVPLGKIFKNQKYCIVDDDLNPVEKGTIGELCLSGSQVCHGYFKSPENNEKSFIRIASMPEDLWYRTGDRVMADKNDCLYFFGRADSELKIKGYRVNLLEIDHAVSSFFKASVVATIAIPDPVDATNMLVTFICSRDVEQKKNETAVINHCKQILPHYMLPEKIFFLDEIPLNNNGKIDRPALINKYKTLCPDGN
ncbi:MAG TPA: AMP-binding protein [Bacteroidales bacterium]|nr:AMP-binding protein [Bacteroidales bacterium]